VTEPEWLVLAREMAALAQSGLTFTRDPYDRERYDALRQMAAKVMAAHTDSSAERIGALFAAETGYATPKIDVRGAAFCDGKILMVREALDGGRWTLPGGWADVNLTPAENVAKEVVEESGFTARVVKLAAAWDRSRQGHGASAWSIHKLFFICEITGGAAATSLETSGVAFFGEDELPEDLSTGRVLRRQLLRMFDHWRDPVLPADFD
jgi:ADP-ribose pyrophosphatase YjhB (NUDIX family)